MHRKWVPAFHHEWERRKDIRVLDLLTHSPTCVLFLSGRREREEKNKSKMKEGTLVLQGVLPVTAQKKTHPMNGTSELLF